MVKIIAGIIALVGLGYLYMTPYMASDHIYEAVTENNEKEIAAHIDLALLNANLKQQVAKELGIELGNGQGKPAAPFAAMMVGRVADMLAAPKGIENLMAGKKPPLPKFRQHNAMPAANGVESGYVHASKGYVSINRFEIKVPLQHPKQGVKNNVLVLEREGLLGWKLVTIRVPL